MKKDYFTTLQPLPFLTFLVILLTQCKSPADQTYQSIRQDIDQIPVINAHEHQHWPEEFGDHDFGFYHVLATTYLSSDIRSAGAAFGDMNELDSLNLEELWLRLGEGLNYSRNTSYYNHFIKGLEQLYGFKELYFTRENIAELDVQIRRN